MRSVTEHQALVAALLSTRAPVERGLADAAGLVIAEPVVAARPLPGFDNSAMDGYAVRAADIADATAGAPVRLPVTADVPAGRTDGPALAPGTAHRIMTGALMPSGADAVVQVEATDGGVTQVAVLETRAPGTHIRHEGEDVRAGEQVLRAGTRLGAAQLGLLAALGIPRVRVFPPLSVLVLSTGSELVEPGEELRRGQIHESNGVMLATAIRAAGAVAEQVHFVADDVEDFLAALRPRLTGVDLVVTSGGVSAGAYEVVKDALAGHDVEFAKVAMQPGMPQGAGRIDGVPIVTLPGNPVSSLVSFEVFLRPAIRAAMGDARPYREVRRLALADSLDSPIGKRQFRRGFLDPKNDRVRTIGPPGSHFLRFLAAADCLIDIPEDVGALSAGELVDVWPVE